MSRLLIFYRLIVRPMLGEPVRTGLTILAIALGVAVALGIDLAGAAATGSFQSSLETLAGGNDLELVAAGGVPESAVGTLAAMPYALRISPRIEDYVLDADSKRSVALIGLDLIGESGVLSGGGIEATKAGESPTEILRDIGASDSIWTGQSLGMKTGERVRLIINDRVRAFTVRGTYPDAEGSNSAIVMDIAEAQNALGRSGRVDRVLVKIPDSGNHDSSDIEKWQERLQAALPAGVQVRRQGAGTEENRKMLGAFRWNLRLLSYIALVVGAFLIYNTISVSVVRRRAEIGIVRALGAGRGLVLAAFVGEAACLGLAGALVGVPLGRVMASGAVKLMSTTVESLYVSSKPGAITLTWESIFLALAVGIGVAVASAYSPAREASMVTPTEAMARGRRDYIANVHKWRDLFVALVLAVSASLASRAPAVRGKPMFGYLATLLLIAAGALAMPALVSAITGMWAAALKKIVGVEGLLASRGLAASLRRTSVLVGALATAIAMMTSVGIMVGSFRETVLLWMNDQLPADLYARAAGDTAPDRHPTMSAEFVAKIAALPGVAAVDRAREYEISFAGLPATLVGVDSRVMRSYRQQDFLSGRPSGEVVDELLNSNSVIVSEPFAYKHHLRRGDSITLPLGESRPRFRIADVYYDYSSERGFIVMDRGLLLRYLPDPNLSNIAIYVTPAADPRKVRAEIQGAAGGRHIAIFSDRDLRGEAIRIFDRTFAITYAMEAIAVMIAVMGVAGALLALVIDRRRELGLLRFLGAAKSQVRKMILVEAGLIGLISTIAGIALGYALSLILIYVVNKQSFGWTIRFHWPVAVLVSALGLVYAATVLAGLYPARMAVGLDPIEAVHEE